MRAQRWGAVMLIDEADVYIKRRDDDITMNAVVGVFLRVLEYFNGLSVPDHQPYRRHRRGDRLALHRVDQVPSAE